MISSNAYDYINVLDKAADAAAMRNELIANNIAGIENTNTIGNYEEGVCMLKYTDLAMLRI